MHTHPDLERATCIQLREAADALRAATTDAENESAMDTLGDLLTVARERGPSSHMIAGAAGLPHDLVFFYLDATE